jgi:hypothetical protein
MVLNTWFITPIARLKFAFFSYIFFVFVCDIIPKIFKAIDSFSNFTVYKYFATNGMFSLKSRYFGLSVDISVLNRQA